MKIIYGSKGTGKTKIVIDEANALVEKAKGHIVFITDTKRYSYDINYNIRLINVSDFGICCESCLLGFIKGIVAGNADNEYIFIDGILRIIDKPLAELENFFNALDELSNKYGVNFILTCSADLEALPEFIKKHL
ncbi:MAG: hypothetical protein E7342_02660 [Clostridiales bacterium]|nr:hypothetical protein [Clostridiales bacterium]